MPFVVKAKIEGLEPLLATLDGLKRSVQKTIIRRAVDAAGKVVLDSIRPLVPTDTGLLQKSMGRKVVVGRRSGVVLAIVGPRTGFKVERAEVRTSRSLTGFRRNRKTGKLSKVILSSRGSRSPVGGNPTQYAHLVESGRKGFAAKNARALAVQGVGFRRSVGPAPATRFMERGLAAARPGILAAMSAAIQEGLLKAARGK